MNYGSGGVCKELELFHNGDNVHAYEYFGAHLEERDGKSGVMFRVWAPNALSVAVVARLFSVQTLDKEWLFQCSCHRRQREEIVPAFPLLQFADPALAFGRPSGWSFASPSIANKLTI